MNNILILTSIAPRDTSTQLAAMNSWSKLSPAIASINHTSELEKLREISDQVRIIPTEDSAIEFVGKPVIFIDSMLDTLRTEHSFSHLLIVNSDIHLTEPDALKAVIEKHPGKLLFGSRMDVEKLESPRGASYGWGFDYFLVPRAMLDLIPPSKFSIGAPFWDYWFPVVALCSEFPSVLCTEKYVRHVMHDQNWNEDSFVYYGNHLYELVRFCIDRWSMQWIQPKPVPPRNLVTLRGLVTMLFQHAALGRDAIHSLVQAEISDKERKGLERSNLVNIANVVCNFIHTSSELVGPSLSIR